MNVPCAPGQPDGGWLLLDSVIGALVLTVGLLACTLVFNESSQSMAQVTARQDAVSLVTSLFSAATAFGCGAETGLSLPGAAPAGPGTGYPDTTTLWDQCASVYRGRADAPYPGALGDPANTHAAPDGGRPYAWSTEVDGTAFDVSYRATWLQAASDASGCPSTLTGGPAAVDPIGQVRAIEVQWRSGGQHHELDASQFAGVPVNALEYGTVNTGGILVTGMAQGSLARLAVPTAIIDAGASGDVAVDRLASLSSAAVTGGRAATGCAWFPFLAPEPSSTYVVSYYAGGDPAAPATATSPESLSVSAGAVSVWPA